MYLHMREGYDHLHQTKDQEREGNLDLSDSEGQVTVRIPNQRTEL